MKRLAKYLIGVVVLLIAVYVGTIIGYNVKTAESAPKAVVKSKPTALAKPDLYGLWTGVNNERTTAGIEPLSWSVGLNNSSKAKCEDMATKHYWDHDTPSGQTPWYFINKYDGVHGTEGENLYYGLNNDSASVVNAWMHSAKHRKNILDKRFTQVGYAICTAHNYEKNKTVDIIVQHFTSE